MRSFITDMTKIQDHVVTAVVVLGITQLRTAWKESNKEKTKVREKHEFTFQQVNQRKYKKLNTEWQNKIMQISPTMDSASLYKWFITTEHSTEISDSALDLWDYYNDPCRSLLETNMPDVAKEVFGHNGIHMRTLNGLLAIRLGISSMTDANESVVIDQLFNYDSICKNLQNNKEEVILKEVLSMKKMYELCKLTTQSSKSCDTYFKKE
jgi:hypothetical protein